MKHVAHHQRSWAHNHALYIVASSCCQYHPTSDTSDVPSDCERRWQCHYTNGKRAICHSRNIQELSQSSCFRAEVSTDRRKKWPLKQPSRLLNDTHMAAEYHKAASCFITALSESCWEWVTLGIPCENCNCLYRIS